MDRVGLEAVCAIEEGYPGDVGRGRRHVDLFLREHYVERGRSGKAVGPGVV